MIERHLHERIFDCGKLLQQWPLEAVTDLGDGPLDGAEEMLLAHDWAIMTTDVVVACNRWQAIADAANRAAESTQGLAELGGFCESFAAALRRNWLS